MTLSGPDKQAIFSGYLARLITFINSVNGYRCIVGEVERPHVLQEIYIKSGASKKKVSFHEYRLAADLKIYKLIDGKWTYLDKTTDYLFAGLFWESLDPECVWGGRFGDNPATAAIEGWDGGHFQYGKKL
jgi:hypothetical protein